MARKTREGTIVLNTQGYKMKCVRYQNSLNIDVMFMDEHKHIKNTCWSNFKKGRVSNPYHASIYGVGIVGDKYPTKVNGKATKEYQTWQGMLFRVISEKFFENYPTYKDVDIDKKWLYYPNFYEWLHEQGNFTNWLKMTQGCLDKDILFKGNKIYSPETCCLVPNCVNTLFVKKDANRGDLPIGVTRNHKRYMSLCSNPLTGNNHEYLGTYDTPKEAFYEYKKYKENIIKLVAEREYQCDNITNKCYKVMVNYVVEIDD